MRLPFTSICVALAMAAAIAPTAPNAQPAAGGRAQIGLALYGEPARATPIEGYPFANPNAEKRGEIRLGQTERIESLFPFLSDNSGAEDLLGLVFESLMAPAADEPDAVYGLIAETVETPIDRSWATFRLRMEAAFSNRLPVSAADVAYSIESLRQFGSPLWRRRLAPVAEIRIIDPQTIHFVFDERREWRTPIYVATAPIIPEGSLDAAGVGGLAPPVATGPYVVEDAAPDNGLILRRDPDYWGRDLGVNRGRHNFDAIRIGVYPDEEQLFDAFREGLVSARIENSSSRWANGYDFPAAIDGRIFREEIPSARPAPANALAFNTRRAPFSDARAREAFIRFFDYDWLNENRFGGGAPRARSLFANTDFESAPGPAASAEVDILLASGARLSEKILNEGWSPPQGGEARIMRTNFLEGLSLLREAGWTPAEGRIAHGRTFEPLTIEILAPDRDWAEIAQYYANSLARIGVEARVARVAPAEMKARIARGDFDLAPLRLSLPTPPGDELFWLFSGFAAASAPEWNIPGVNDPAVNALIASMLQTPSRAEYAASLRALDRMILAGAYMIPLDAPAADRVARWTDVELPAPPPVGFVRNGRLAVDFWWASATN
ncbi:MAG: extracellular solute-binding protein [Parvularculaceae bacterium]